MSARMVVEFPGGNKVVFAGRGPVTGLAEAALGGEIAKVASDRFQEALGSLGDLVSALEQSVAKLGHRPDSVELEFGASLSGECDLWIVSGEGEAEFKVKLKWGKADKE
jgi:Trypsin-co-occurring domain 1